MISRTAEKLAQEHGVSRETIKRAGKLALEVEADPELKEAIRTNVPLKQIKKERQKAKIQQTNWPNLAGWLGPLSLKLAIGRRYNRKKKAIGRPKKSGQIVHLKTAEELAKEHGVNEKTVRRAGKFALEVEADPALQ